MPVVEYDQFASLPSVDVPPDVTAIQFGHAATVKFVPFQHLPDVESLIDTFTALMPWLPVVESFVVPVRFAGKPAAL